MADWVSFLTPDGKPKLLNIDRALYAVECDRDPNKSVIDGHTIDISIQELALALGAQVIKPGEV